MRAVFIVLLAASVLVLSACAQGPEATAPTTQETGRSIESVVAAHNQRVGRLDRLWARAIVEVRFTDAQGDRKWEQGNGFFQLRDRDNLALSVGKVGEVLLWIGCDSDRYWVLDRLNTPTAYSGHHDTITPERLSRAGLPVPPQDLLRLAGLRPIDPERAEAVINEDGYTRVTERDDAGAWRYTFAPAPGDDLPISIARLDAEGNALLRAGLELPKTVLVTSEPPARVRTFGRVLVEHLPTGDTISVRLDGEVEDGRRRGVPNPAVFDLDVLLDAYGPFERVIDLDASEPG